MKKGQEAAKRGDWKKAAEEFKAAAWSAPYAPAVLYNRGLVYDRMGRELEAIRQYNGFLVAAPGARNAAQVRARIKELQASVRDKAKRLLIIVEGAVRQLPAKSFDRGFSTIDIAEAYAAMGDVRKALAITARIDKNYMGQAIGVISRTQAMWGDFEGARKTRKLYYRYAKGASGTPERSIMSNYQNIARYMAWEGDVANALKGANELEAVAKKRPRIRQETQIQQAPQIPRQGLPGNRRPPVVGGEDCPSQIGFGKNGPRRGKNQGSEIPITISQIQFIF